MPTKRRPVRKTTRRPTRKTARKAPAKRVTRRNAASKAKGYNGHKNWNYWNVSLWIGNDDGLYRMARALVRSSKNRTEAAEAFVQTLRDEDITETPDGAKYTVPSVRAAMSDLG